VRILFLPERFPPQSGGVAVSAQRNARHLAPHLERLEVLYLDGDLPAGTSDTHEESGYLVHRLGRAERQEDSLQLLELAACRLARHMQAQIVHGFHAVPAGFVATLVARRLGLPSVVSLRGNDVDRGVFSQPGMLHWTLSQATRVLAVSRELGHRVAAFAGRQDTLFTPNSVDSEIFGPGPAAVDLGTDPVVLFAGEMRFKKGLQPFLEAAALLADSPLRFVLAGGVRRDDRPAFQAWMAGNPRARVRELPYVRDPERMRALYCRADLVLLPALFEGMPNALLEAMACARPVLATEVGGIPDLVQPERTGWLIPPEDLHLLDRHLVNVLSRPAGELQAVGAAARRHVLTDFTPQAESDRLLAVYRSL